MPPPRALKKGDEVFCLLGEQGRHTYQIEFRGNPGDSEALLIDVGTDWLSEPDTYGMDELLLVKVKVLKRMRRKPQKAKIVIT